LQKLNAGITNQLLTVPQKEQFRPTSKQPLQMVFLKELVEKDFISSWSLKKGKQYTLLNQTSQEISNDTNKNPTLARHGISVNILCPI